MIVVDTNVLVYFATFSPWSDAADALAHRDSEWHAPLLWRSEFRNVMAGELRRGSIGLADALAALTLAENRLGGRVHFVPDAEVMRLAAQTRCSAYDLEYAALALRLQAPLVTMDRQLLKAFPQFACPLPPA